MQASISGLIEVIAVVPCESQSYLLVLDLSFINIFATYTLITVFIMVSMPNAIVSKAIANFRFLVLISFTLLAERGTDNTAPITI